ncbi:competence protein ComK [Bacillus atrophaeus]|uniref:competence protein ComK n=1 Tax=Bacillus atrophaeus TaxID=1452 RepID=UPI00228301A4|nr:competence protein ComK [Bacillus atrophaeus]
MSQKTDAPLDTYEVNSSTIAVLPEPMNGKMYSKIIEKDCTFYVSMKPLQIVDRSCRYFGSSYAGRKAGTYEVINISHKPPIMVDLSNHIFLFPTLSSTRPQCGWISHVHVKEFKATEFDDTAVTFSNGKTMELPVSCNSFDNRKVKIKKIGISLLCQGTKALVTQGEELSKHADEGRAFFVP